ncbi:aminotransferase class V-fold PLP-dependent enzyme [Pseudonocardia sp. KRD-184]|uniref:Aminotransferase class V-fold PLP-dependent enzyme n=1 Tax=Pseudonocardia oceani TaxID=2792013 RepID=A0ABS6UKR1_9PSEU|nr:aminotransferase class V-fold PLP-dependent enzyme [Pseudonocardia oceani]MBW0090534.1 aminotransferase class V-fold PLP-dependent enzyme [Pseudonocardia oceani]MBW0095343.1 aminotransferase class V-fold PLP-dependent enzyme [Pseudonocardia oceani]MBW0108113.1 aminotransferase class V-fold PLP-dependent enzyme [Pseudonocardia oceani]MBW0120065.1 aminotransferase class V-fold PLP-dependent enzyme [Pseudonocardia oceani]MBW0132521.1 aminotransferase class V-fold PLP-dependent enzyme [Pseudono
MGSVGSTAYYDCAATTPVDDRVAAEVLRLMTADFGNAGSRTHEVGAAAQAAVTAARTEVARAVGARADEVVFTSGATEADNIAVLGLAAEGERTDRRHVVVTAIEHKAVLEPAQELARRGFDVTVVAPHPDGAVRADDLLDAVRPDTLLVSLMHANNETGVIQPVAEVAAGLAGHEAWLHVDAAQTFGKLDEQLCDRRIDLISVSGHKVFAPQGVGALIARRRGYARVPLQPLTYGGGQERGLRAGTVPMPLVAGLGLAVRFAREERALRVKECLRVRDEVLHGLAPLDPVVNGAASNVLPHVLNLSLPGIDGEAVMVAWRGLLAVSNGSACTSASYSPSHVLTAMGLTTDRIRGALRLSWSHTAPDVDWPEAVRRAQGLR